VTGLVPFPQRNRFPTRYRGGGSRSPPRCEDTWGGTPGGGHPPRPTFPRWGPNDRKQCRARYVAEQ
jgi:hypothetical protein